MKWLRKTRNKISKEIHNLTAEEVGEYYRKGFEESRERAKELRKQNTHFFIICDDYLTRVF